MWETAVRYTELEKELKKIMSMQVAVYRDEFDAIKNLLNNLGIPCIMAETEGEMACAELAIAGETAATFSTDSDCLALGIPFFFDSITGTKKGKGGFIKGTVLAPVLETLKLSMSEFRDFCILLGTDFNERMPGYGPSKGFKLIEDYRSIEKIEESGLFNVAPLNYKRTRELITPKLKEWDQKELDIKFEQFEALAGTVLDQYSISSIYTELKEAVQNVKSVRYGLI